MRRNQPCRRPRPQPRSRNGRRASTPSTKSLSEFITERFDEFSRSQKDVARYIVDHLEEAAFQTAEELARRANTSSSTVVRFSQALGFEGYPSSSRPRSRSTAAALPTETAPHSSSTSTTRSSRRRSRATTRTSRRPHAA